MAELKIQVDIDTEKGEREAKSNLGRAGVEAGRSFSLGFGSALKIGLGIAAIRAVGDGIRFITDNVRESVRAAQQLEVYETQFKTILGSTKAAQAQLESLQKFAATTPFQLDGLSVATRQLLSFGVAQQDIIPTLRQIGELAAGTGSAIEDLTIPYGRLISTQKLTLIELDKFADRGINLYGKLSEQTGISLKNIRDEISKGRVGFDEFTKALNSLTQEGGIFFGATVAQSKTLAGLFSTLGDNVQRLRGAVGQAVTPLLKGFTTDLIAGLQKTTEFFIANSDIIVNQIFGIARSATFLIKPFQIFFNVVSTGFSALRTGIATVVAGIGTLLERSLTTPLEAFSKFPGQLGQQAQSALSGIRNFATASRQVLEEEAAITQEKLFGLFQTDNIDAQIRSALEKYRELSLEGAEAFKKILEAAKNNGGKIADEAVDLGKTLNNALGNQVANGVEKLSQSIAAGENIFKAFSANIIGIVADFAIQAGKIFIATGIAQLQLFSGNPTGLIAAGAALVALGTLAKSIFGGGLDQGANGANAIGQDSAPLATQAEFSAPTPEERGEPETRVSVTIMGDVLDSEESSLRIVQLLQKASFDNNVKVIGGLA